MNEILSIDSISQLHQLLELGKMQHPLVTVVDFSKAKENYETPNKIVSGLYSIMFKKHCHGALKYGRKNYDFQDGTLIFIGHGQVFSIEPEPQEEENSGWGLFFHPDLIRGTSLAAKMKEYTFFSYDTHEALHLSDTEKEILQECISKIELELSHSIDKHSQTLIVSNIELLLNYCSRYYDRQFITRSTKNKDLLAKFEDIVTDHFKSEILKKDGLPTVKQCASQLNLSPNYLSDLLKKETGKNAQELIHFHLVEEAKNRLLASSLSVSEVAYELGFEYPQYFSKMFKKKTGISPGEYRKMN